MIRYLLRKEKHHPQPKKYITHLKEQISHIHQKNNRNIEVNINQYIEKLENFINYLQEKLKQY